MKRYRKNSVIYKASAYKLAKKFNLHPSTFKAYIKEAIKLGYVEESPDRYKIIKFKDIISNFAKETGLYFGPHQIIQSGGFDSKKVLQEVQGLLVIDNIIGQQEVKIARKQNDIRLINFATQTVKRGSFLPKSDMKRLRSLMKEGKLCAKYAKKLSDSTHQSVITSARHTAKKLGVSVKKANSILNSKQGFTRRIWVQWIKGVSFYKIEMLRIQFPKATVIPLPHYNLIKVCFGSELSLGAIKPL